MDKPDKQTSARVVAWSALLLGAVMSVAANALHVVLVTGPSVGGASVAQVVSAAFWPVALIISVEVIARVSWPDKIGFTLLRWGGVGAVALVAAIVSYGHMHGLLLHWGESMVTALLGPIGVDGLVTVGAVALMAIGHQPTTVKAKAKRTEPVPAPTQLERTPTESAPADPEPVVVGPTIDEAAMKKAGLPSAMHDQVVERLRSVLAEGRAPEPADLAATGLPSSFASRIISAGINGRQVSV